MRDLPKSFGTLGAVVAFCSAEMVGLLRECPPLSAAKRAALCALALGLVSWAAAHVALSVLRAGAESEQENKNTT